MDDLASAFDYATPATPTHGLPQNFSSPPLTPGLRSSLHDFLGHEAHPTPIQRLSLAHLVGKEGPVHAMIAAETGSGKSLAYLLPMLQELKRTESSARQGHGPRALVLSPTHELARQLAFFGKQLVHHDKLRIQTASRANVKSNATASKMSETFGEAKDGEGEFAVTAGGAGAHGVDVLVGTTRKLLEMARGRGWHKVDEDLFEKRRPRKPAQPEISLKDVEWVIVDEADVLYNKDFIEETEALLSDVAIARGQRAPAEGPASYPFNLILSSATIPVLMNNHLSTRLPHLQRLVSPSVHRLPSKLAVEFSAYTSGNRHADVERKIRELWADDAHCGRERDRIVVFANGRGTVETLGKYLTDKGLPNVAVTGGADARVFGSNKHLKGFLSSQPAPATAAVDEGLPEGLPKALDNDKSPRVLVSTALLARGMDFSPDVRTVFLLDAPATAADFLHRAGRTARAGRPGRLVIFERAKGRGSEYGKVVRRSLAALGRTRQSVKE
ncbi:P-loop containing nucleoside triphosphate hydrolase protein [Peniophora sp. CONT]|nr:P-loop containing nucleoside triphosphate hydrolase protein [Peniophora sp. CONT]